MEERLLGMEAEFLKALAHPTRLRILKFLREGEKCVCEFTEDFDLDQPYVSQHLAILRKQGILKYRKEGVKVIYRICCPEILEFLDSVEKIILCQIDSTMVLLKNRMDSCE